MGFLSWLGKKTAQAGAAGETARTVGQQYLALKAQNPAAKDEEIFSTIIAARHAAQPYTPAQLARLDGVADAKNVGEFVIHLLLIESNVRATEIQGAPLQSLIRAVNEELRLLGLDVLLL